jgi:GAF domain
LRNFIITIVIALFGFFVSFEFLGGVGNSVFKILLFLALAYVLYLIFQQTEQQEESPAPVPDNQSPAVERTKISVESNLLTDNNESIVELLNDKDLSVNSLVVSQFEILFNFYIPNNGYIFLETSKENTRLFYKNIKTGIQWKDTQEIPHIIKLVKNHNDDILIENNLNAQSKLLPFYDMNNYSPGSVFALRTSLGNNQAFYFIFDVPDNGFFNEEDFSVPVQVNFTLQYIIKNALKLKELNKNFITEITKLKLTEKLNQSANQNELIGNYVEFLAEIFEAHKLTIAMSDRNNENIAEIIKTVGQLDSIKEGTRFAIDEGLCGKVILNKQVYLIDDIEKDGYFIPRFSKNEKTNFGLRSFLGIPLLVMGDTVGMISMEHKIPNTYTKHHKDLLKNYNAYFEAALQRVVKKKGD